MVDLLDKLGMENGWIQEMSAPENYQPDFEQENSSFYSALGKQGRLPT